MSGNRIRAGRVGGAAHSALAAALALLLAGCAASPAGTPPAAAPEASVAPAAAASSPRLATVAPSSAAASALPKFPDPASPQWIAGRIAALEALRGSGRAADPGGALALELALLHSHPSNPAADHIQALLMMRAYLALAPPGSRDPLVLHVAGLLEDIDQLGKITRDARGREKELAAKTRGLEQRAAEAEQRAAGADQRDAAAKKREQELLAQIATLQQRIEQLQQLDLEMEKRRRSVK